MSKGRCPNCGQKFMEKIMFQTGITIWRETDEICLHNTDGKPMIYLHKDGGDGSDKRTEPCKSTS